MKPFGTFLSSRVTRVLALSSIVSLAAGAQVLDQVPADAMGVVKVKNVQAVSDKIGGFAKQWGLAEMTPAAADPLGFLLEKGAIKQGVDKGGDMAIVVANHDLNDEGPPPIIVLVPVTDYAQFLTNFKDVGKDGDVDHFKGNVQGGDNEESYSVHWGNYAAVTPMKELLAKKPEGFKADGPAAKELETKDVVFLANFKVLGPKLEGMLAAQKEKMIKEVTTSLTNDAEKAKYAPLAEVVLTQLVNAASEFLKDAQTVTYSIDLNKDGISTSLMAQCLPDSYLGETFDKIKGKSGPLIVGLPEAKYLFFLGGINSGAGGKMLADFLAPIEPEVAKLGEQGKAAMTFIDCVKKMAMSTKAESMGLIAPTGALGTSSLLQSVTLVTGDAKMLLGIQKDMMDSQQQLMGLLPNQPAGGMKVDWKPDAKTVDGVNFAEFSTTVANENDPVAMRVKSMMTMMYGPAGATAYVGEIDDQHLLTYLGLDDATVSAAIKSAKEGADTFGKNEQITMVDKYLPQTRMAVVYMDLGGIVETAGRYMKMMAIPIPINIKPNLPPIGMAVATDGPSIRVDTFIPSDLVEQMIAMGLQLKMMGGGNGKPGGL